MRLNPETAKMAAHRLLISADVFTDPEFGASDCRMCKQATLNKAHAPGSRLIELNDGLDFDLKPGGDVLPSISDLIWPAFNPEQITWEWDRAIFSAHSRHANRN